MKLWQIRAGTIEDTTTKKDFLDNNIFKIGGGHLPEMTSVLFKHSLKM